MKKKFLLLATFVAFVFVGLAQVPEAFNYQAVVRNTSGEVVANQIVSFRISILQGSESGTVLYAETHTVSTNAFGLVNLKVGNGTLFSGVFSPDGWGATSHFLKVEIDPAGGSAYTHLGTSELLSVPYAFHAQTVQTDMVEDADADPTNELQTISLIGSELTLSDGGGTVTLPTPSGGDDWGTQTVESDATLTGNGTSGDPLGVVGDLTDNQTLSIVGSDLSISEGNTVALPGDDWGTQTVESDATLAGVGTLADPLGVVGDLTDDQTLSIVGNDLSISGGNTVAIPGDDWGTQVVQSNSTLSGNGTGSSPLSVNGDLTDDQTLTLAGDNLSISNGNSVNIGSADNQSLSIAGNNLSITNGNTVALPTSPWSLNGSNVYYNTGTVGIGTSTPIRPLHIYSANYSHVGFHSSYTGTTINDGLLVGIETAGNNAYVYNYENGPLRLGAGGDTRLSILPSGNVGIGTYSPVRLLDLHGGSSHSIMSFHSNSSGNTTTDGFYLGLYSPDNHVYLYNYENSSIYFATNATWRMEIDPNGRVGINHFSPDQMLTVGGNASKTVGGITWVVYSDRRLKDLHGDYNKGLSEILALQPILFNYKVDNPLDLPSDNEEVGLIAQDVQEIFPEAVSVSRNGYLDFNMHPIIVAYVNAIKELKAANDDLQEQVNELESRLAKIEKMLQQ
jgi:hypothetical protein